MTITVASGVTSGPLTISSGDPLVVLSGGTISSITVLSGGSATLSAGAVGELLRVSHGGVLLGPGDLDGVDSVSGLVSGVTIGDTGVLGLFSGGTASGVSIAGAVNAASGASVAGTVVLSAGTLNDYGSAAHTVVEYKGDEVIDTGGVGSGDVVRSGGYLVLEVGATAIDETVQSGGWLYLDGDLTSNYTLQPLPATSTSVLEGVTVSSGGNVVFENATVLAGATLSVTSKAAVYGLAVSKGGAVVGPGELLESNVIAGSISGLTVAGSLELTSGGTERGVTVIGSTTQIDPGASATGTVVLELAGLRVFGSVSGAVLEGDGVEVVYSGGAASGDIVQADGDEVVSSGGVADGTMVSSGGSEFVESAGRATGTVVSNGGREYVYSGGQTLEATVSSGGSETMYAGAGAIGQTVLSGGVLADNGTVQIAGAGTLDGTLSGSGTIVQTAAGDLVMSGAGAGFSGRAVIEGGTVELATAAALGTGYLEFVEPSTGSAVLQIDAADAPAAGGTFSNLIDDFSGANEDIDLRSLAFVSGASATVLGSTLVLTDGGKTYTFDIAGTTAGAYPVLSDGHGGTLIDPATAVGSKAIDPKVTLFAQATAAFAPPDAATAALVSGASPAGQTLFLHATASATAGRL
jgi:autotransporter passenger strand-loop-strand repeat protein